MASPAPPDYGDLPLFEARAARDKGIKLVTEHNQKCKERAAHSFPVLRYEFGGSTVTGEDIRLWYEAAGIKPQHPNFWGAFINGCVKKGWLEATGEYRQMKKKTSHARETKVWRFLDPKDPL